MKCNLGTVVNNRAFCNDCGKVHAGHALRLSQDEGERGVKWRKNRMAKSRKLTLLRSLPLAKQCQYFGERLTAEEVKEKQLAGCRTCSNQIFVFHCKYPGQKKFNDGPYTRSGAECMSCKDWKLPENNFRESPKGSMQWPKDTTIRHLLYHIYPVSNGHWRWNVEQLCGRLKMFNGHKIVAIAVDPPTGRLPDPTGPHSPDRGRHIPGCDSVEEVKAEFGRRWGGDPITFMEFENDPSLREVKTFIPMLEQVLTDDPNHLVWYAQAKGTTRHNGHIARRWTEALYEIMLDHFPLVEEQLKTYPVTGCFKKLGPGWSPDQSHSDFHYSGSWWAARVSELAKRPYWKIDQFWSGIEPYPSQQFEQKEAGCVFHTERVPTMNLYSSQYWRRAVTPAFNRWREENAKFRTEMWPK